MTLILFLGMSIANTAVPYLLGQLANMLSLPAQERIPAMVMGLAFAYAAVWTTTQLFTWIKGIASAVLHARSENALYQGFFYHLIRLKRKEQKHLDSGVVLSEIERAYSSFGHINYSLFFSIIPILFELFAVYIILWSKIDIFFAAAFTSAIILLFCIAYTVANRTASIHHRIFGAHNLIASHLSERMRLLDDIRYNNAHAKEEALAKSHMSAYVRTVSGAHLRIGGMMGLQTLCLGLILTVFTVYVTRETLTGQRTVGDFVMVVGYISQLTAPFMMIAGSLIELKKNYTALNAGLSYIDKEHDRDRGGLAPDALTPVFELDGVQLQGTGSERIRYRFEAGRMHVIGGPSGVGKTTLLQAMFGLTQVVSGTIRFQGKMLSEIGPADIFSRVAVVPQDPVVVSGSLRDNLLYGAPNEVPDARLLEFVDLLGLRNIKQDISGSPLDIEISPSDPFLSGGERQRIVIGRALARGMRTIVLDEPTSALDQATELTVLTTLREHVDTLIVVSHRQAVFDMADSVLFLSRDCRASGAPIQCLA